MENQPGRRHGSTVYVRSMIDVCHDDVVGLHSIKDTVVLRFVSEFHDDDDDGCIGRSLFWLLILRTTQKKEVE